MFMKYVAIRSLVVMAVTLGSAPEKCEKILIKSREYNVTHSILPSEIEIIDRLLASRKNMGDVYKELAASLNEQQIDVFLSLVLSCAAFWNPYKTASYRSERQELIETNREIAIAANGLAKLLERRHQLHNCSGFSSDTHYSIINIIEQASSGNGLYNMYIKEPLSHLRGRFDLKYWPNIEDVIYEIASDAERAVVYATDSVTEASTASNRASKVDFLKALFAAIRENSREYFGLIPNEFDLSDKSIAEVMNSALNLDFNELVDAAYVKRARQRIREASEQNA